MTTLAATLSHGLLAFGRGCLDALLPQTCAACGTWIPAATTPLCEACHSELADAAGVPTC